MYCYAPEVQVRNMILFLVSSCKYVPLTVTYLQSLIRTRLREIVLRPDLQAYGRIQTVASMTPIERTPLVLMKVSSLDS